LLFRKYFSNIYTSSVAEAGSYTKMVSHDNRNETPCISQNKKLSDVAVCPLSPTNHNLVNATVLNAVTSLVTSWKSECTCFHSSHSWCWPQHASADLYRVMSDQCAHQSRRHVGVLVGLAPQTKLQAPQI